MMHCEDNYTNYPYLHAGENMPCSLGNYTNYTFLHIYNSSYDMYFFPVFAEDCLIL